MSGPSYARLSQLDRSFLLYEGPSSPMHVGGVQVLEAGPLRSADGTISIERIQEYVTSRLDRVPRYRQKVIAAPLDRHPIWVDDERFNVRYHVRHSRLPTPGSERILKRTCARIFEQPLDLHRPLWEIWLVEGLEGDRAALVSKVHHCMIDGVSGVQLLNEILTPQPTEKIEAPPPWRARPAPGVVDYASREAVRRVRLPFQLAGALRRVLTNEERARDELIARVRGALPLLGAGLGVATPTPLNQAIGPHRRFDWLAMSLDEIREVRARLGGTVNDVVLAVAAGALRRYLKRVRQTDPDTLQLKAMAPVSVRDASEQGRLGNRVSAWIIPLPIAERDPAKRLAAVRETTEALKRNSGALGADTLSQAVEWLGSTPIALSARLLEYGAPFNLVVTNVRGPSEPLYLLGARMLEAHPMVPLVGTLGVGIALLSYGRTLSWGFTADWDLVPDLHELVLAVSHEFERLRQLAAAA